MSILMRIKCEKLLFANTKAPIFIILLRTEPSKITS